MRRLFSLSSKRSDLPTLPHSSLIVPHHLYPHEYIAVVASEDGLIMRPYTTGPQQHGSHVRVSWGKERKVEALLGESTADWTSSVLIYGIIGVLDLFNGIIGILQIILLAEKIGSFISSSHHFSSERRQL